MFALISNPQIESQSQSQIQAQSQQTFQPQPQPTRLTPHEAYLLSNPPQIHSPTTAFHPPLPNTTNSPTHYPSYPTLLTRSERKILLYNIQTHSFRLAYPSDLLSPSVTQPSPARQRVDIAKAIEIPQDENNTSTLLSPTIRVRGGNTWGDTTNLEEDNKKYFPLLSTPKTIVSSFLSLSHPQRKSPIIHIPVTEYNFCNPPLLTSDPAAPRYMIVPFDRWSRYLEFNWRTRTYGLTEREIREGGSVVWTRRQRVPVWVWVGRNFGWEDSLDGLGETGEMRGGSGSSVRVRGLWEEVWVERGA